MIHPKLKCCWIVVVTLLLLATANSHAGNEPLTFSAVDDFTAPKDTERYVPFYRETRNRPPEEQGLAINTVHHAGAWSAAEVVFRGPTGRYRVELEAVAEEDGQSTYLLYVNDRHFGSRHNPLVPVKRLPFIHAWEAVPLQAGDRIRIVFRGASAGNIPEDDGFAWARGRWRSLTLHAQEVVDGA